MLAQLSCVFDRKSIATLRKPQASHSKQCMYTSGEVAILAESIQHYLCRVKEMYGKALGDKQLTVAGTINLIAYFAALVGSGQLFSCTTVLDSWSLWSSK